MHISDFTYEQKQTIDAIFAKNLENLTSDEVQLYGQWVSAVALGDAEFAAEQERLKAESDARIAALQANAVTAKQNLDDLKNAALARLEAIDEQTK